MRPEKDVRIIRIIFRDEKIQGKHQKTKKPTKLVSTTLHSSVNFLESENFSIAM